MATRKHFPLPLGAVIDPPEKPAAKTAAPRHRAARVSAGVEAARQAAGLTGKPPAPAQPASAKTAAPATVPTASGLGLDSARARAALVAKLVAFGIQDQMVLDAIGHVPRHRFIDPGLASQAYEDTALPIGHQQTISKPSIVARMVALMRAPLPAGTPLHRVLEIGTGCGYQAAVLSLVAKEVYSIERIKPLYERAKANLRPLRVPNIRLLYGDGMLGAPTVAPFDAIVLAAAGVEVPQTLLEQLAVGGRLIAPVAQANGRQQLRVIERIAQNSFKQTDLEGVFFVPLKSGTA